MSNPEVPSKNGPSFPLGLKLTLALLFTALVMVGFLLGYFGPRVRESFQNRSDVLINLSSDALREMVLNSTSQSHEILVDLIYGITDARQREIKDLPLSLYEGDVNQIRRMVEETEDRRKEHHQRNVEILAEEMEDRQLEEVGTTLERIGKEQEFTGAAFAADIRRAYLILAGSVFLALFVMLGFGLYRTVAHPIRQLRKATRAVARGDLEVPVPVGGRDEVGGLSADFAAMVRQLQASQETVRNKSYELEELNRNLEDEVARKTGHLEQALDDLRRTQRQLIHAEKMASIGTLAGGVAHEFNNLIGGIRGCAAEALETEDNEHRREPLEVILRAADRAGEITDQLLRFSRQRAMKMETVDMTRLLEEALVLIEPEARKRKVRISRRIEGGAPFLADGDALHQVFLNFYTNALQAMQDGGELTVEAKAESRDLVIRITDTGVGIPAEHRDRIFEPFFTTRDQDSDPALRGSGLGLSVSYSIVEAHGGTVEVQSEVGRGSVFTVRLPMTESAGAGPGEGKHGDRDPSDGGP